MNGATPIVLVTGATAGIGRACCERFLAAGALVVGIGRRRDRLDRFAALHGDRFLPLCADIREAEKVRSAINGLPHTHRTISVLINNAGLALGPSSFMEGNRQQWRTMLDTNVVGLLNVTDAVLPGMVARDSGHIFNVGSIGGLYPSGSSVYGGTKAFVRHFSLALRRDLKARAIRVTCVSPGSTATEFRAIRSGQSGTEPLSSEPGTMTAEDVAEAIYMCNALPAHVNVNQIELMPVRQTFGGFETA